MNAATTRIPAGAVSSRQPADPFDDVGFGIQRTATADLPAAELQAVVLARALIEVLSGRRSAAQVAAHCTQRVAPELLCRIPPGPLALPHLLTVRVCEPADGVVEAAAVFRRAGQVHAVAFRLEGLDRRWQITVLEFAGSPTRGA